MAEVTTTNPTLVDVATRSVNGEVTTDIVELMHETNEVLDDATFIECNEGSSHKTTVRTGIPVATWRLLNYGVMPTKGTTAQIRDACGMLENYAKVDKALAQLNGNSAAWRLSEERGHIEGMNQGFVDSLFYGNTATNPERFMGLAPRFNDRTNAENKDNIIHGGGAGSDNTSVWLVVWGPTSAHCLYPNGSPAGLQARDLGEDTATDANGREYQILRTHYKWDVGFTLRDWRQVVRIANVDVSDLTKNAASGADLVDLMMQALEQVYSLRMGRPVFYVNRTVRSYLRRQMVNKTNLCLSLDDVAGKKVLSFDGVPVRRCDAILNTEATVS